ncbi:MAG: hypothetical protein D6694_15365 [Gammaproteobacteria bacterium]|nr:MAG: hypothetical protein D6694_15365 [Gammaproteobacteria bacterium]
MTRRVAITLVLASVLAACAGPRTPESHVRIQRIEVPVPCVRELPQRPTSPVETLQPDAALGDMVKALLAEPCSPSGASRLPSRPAPMYRRLRRMMKPLPLTWLERDDRACAGRRAPGSISSRVLLRETSLVL